MTIQKNSYVNLGKVCSICIFQTNQSYLVECSLDTYCQF